MNTILKTGTISALALMLVTSASFAQGELLGTKVLNDQIDDIETDVAGRF